MGGTNKFHPEPGAVTTFEWPPDLSAVGASKKPLDSGAVGTFELAPDPGDCMVAQEALLRACLVASFISPAHKWTEVRAPVWGSEFTFGTYS